MILIFLIGIMFFQLSPMKVKAEDDGYYIKNMKVDVEVNDKREYIITETIDAYFKEKRHGIKREIPKATKLESFNIKDISVDGGPMTMMEYSSDVTLTIGDIDDEITGDKRYVIKYTLSGFSNEQDEGEYVYLNVLGDKWTTRIENFESTITFPKDAKLQKMTLTDGKSGSNENAYSSHRIEGNKIFINSTKTIEPYCAVTINALFNKEAFKNIPVRTYPYTINKDIVNIEITKEKEYLINRQLQVTINEDEDYAWSSLNFWQKYDNREKIYYLNCDNTEVTANLDGSLSIPKKKGTYNINLSYKVRSFPGSEIGFHIYNSYREGKTENLVVNIKSQVRVFNQSIGLSQVGPNKDKKRYEVNRNENEITMKTLNTLYPEETLYISSLGIDEKAFEYKIPGWIDDYILKSLIIIPIILGIYLIFGNKKLRFISPVEFYPPEGMNSAELAYLYNGSISNSDITTLIFYWASQNHLKIVERKRNKYTLIKIKELDSSHKDYEKVLFEQLFLKGNGTSVKSENISGDFYKEVSNAAKNIAKQYKGKKKIKSTLSYVAAAVSFIICTIPLIILTLANEKLYEESIFDSFHLPILALNIVILLILFGILVAIKIEVADFHNILVKVISYIVLSSIFTVILIFIYRSNPFISRRLVILCALSSTFGALIASFIPKRSKYGNEMLGKILGFRKFIKTAEKERLEALLNEDPEYFYNTLPFAQVLGVTKIWSEKFSDLTMVSPKYYEGYNPNDFMFMYIINSMNDLNKDMIHTPGSSSDGSFYDGGSSSGGGFSGGGSSGGGAGGGGGSSW